MKKGFVLFLLFGLLSFSAFATDIDFYAGLEEARWDGKQKMRLLAVYPADMPNDVLIKTLLVPKDSPETRHGDLLVHAILANDTWLQGLLVEEGRAMVMPVYETDWGRLYYLKNLETGARQKGLGLWAENPVVCADNAEKAFDSFAIVQGRLKQAADVRGTIYLNFGTVYRDDFTVKITRSTFRTLPENLQEHLRGLTAAGETDMMVEARGWVFYSGGPMIEVKAGATLDFYEPGDPLIVERCT